MHQKVHDPYLTEKRKDTILVRALPVSSRIMGVSGECDLVEFHKCEDGIRLHGHRGMYSVYPVEYKKGKEKSTDADRLQLVAQVLCLEEMFSATIPEAALFYGETAGRTRLRKVAKQCTNYGRRVQNSVFECILDSAQSVALKGILSDIIDKNKDSLRFYYLGNNYQTKIEHVGIERGIPVDQPLIM